MDSESHSELFSKLKHMPGLLNWQKETVLLLRCQDIDKSEFRHRVEKLHSLVKRLFDESQVENLDEEVYLLAKDYYNAASPGLGSYIAGLEALLTWSEVQDSKILNLATYHFTVGDEHTRKLIPIAVSTQKSFLETTKALADSLAARAEGIDFRTPEVSNENLE